MHHYQFKIITTLVEAEDELLTHGLQHLYTIEEPGFTTIGGFCTQRQFQNLAHCQLIADDDGGIDWVKEWQTHAPDFDGRYMHMKRHGLRFEPGPGFGDMSHPTTSLMVELVEKSLGIESAIDLGCGSGVLGCVALKSNVKPLYMVDIDEDAIDHARLNVKLNNLSGAEFATHVKPDWNVDMIMMNMIWQEQVEVMKAYPFLQEFTGTWLLSGILKEQCDDYIEWFELNVDCIVEDGGWVAMRGSKHFPA